MRTPKPWELVEASADRTVHYHRYSYKAPTPAPIACGVTDGLKTWVPSQTTCLPCLDAVMKESKPLRSNGEDPGRYQFFRSVRRRLLGIKP